MPAKDVTVEPVFFEIYPANIGDKYSVGKLYYKITNNAIDGTGTVMVDSVKKSMETDEKYLFDQYGKIDIPADFMLNGVIYKVTAIGPNAFKNFKYIKTVTIGSNVAVIGDNAFYGCVNLSKVSGGIGVKTIGKCAFARCSKLSTFVITSNVLSKIGVQAFYKDSKLKTLYIRNTVSLTKKGVKKSLKGSKVKTVKVKKAKVKKYKKYFTKKNCGRKVKVKK